MTLISDEPVFILTAALEAEKQAWLDELRARHFPKERNFLKAHLTIFHRLTPAQKNCLEAVKLPDEPLPVRFDTLRLLGYGVAVNVDCPSLLILRAELVRAIGGEVTKQDKQKFRPHVTIQNKVEPSVARELYQVLSAGFIAREGAVTGLQFWKYLGGPWERASQNRFGRP